MKEIVTRLHENRQIQLAKSILENAGYKIEKIEESAPTMTAYEFGQMCIDNKLLYSVSNSEYAEIRDLYLSGKSDATVLINDIQLSDTFGRSRQDIAKILSKYGINESTDTTKKFKVGDIVEWSGLYGGSYKGKVKKITNDEVLLDVSWIAEDTGEVVHAGEIRKLEKDSEGNDSIIVWEYHGEKGRVYPSSND